MTRELPILFSPPMIRANLADLKTETRRLRGLKEINEAPDEWAVHSTDAETATLLNRLTGELRTLKCPYGAAGTRLWVREQWWHYRSSELELASYDDGATRCNLPSGKTHDEPPKIISGKPFHASQYDIWKKRPSMFMPKWASRLTLEVIGWRLERLQEITEAGAIAEGCKSSLCTPEDGVFYPGTWTAKLNYARLWDHLNGKAEQTAWAANPWVWVIQYRRCAA